MRKSCEPFHRDLGPELGVPERGRQSEMVAVYTGCLRASDESRALRLSPGARKLEVSTRKICSALGSSSSTQSTWKEGKSFSLLTFTRRN